MAKASVRTHTRNIPGVGTVTVQRHNRSTRGGPDTDRYGMVFKAARAGRNLKRAVKAARRHKKLTAGVCLGLGVAELGGWLALRSVGLVLITAAVIGAVLGGAHVLGGRSDPPWANGASGGGH